MEKIALFESKITFPFDMGKRKCWLCRQSFRKGLGGEGVLSNDLICIFLLSEVGGINTCLQRGANWLKVHGV